MSFDLNGLKPLFVLFLLGFVWVMWLLPAYIVRMRQRMLGQYIREDGPEAHQQKAGTPTGGGIIMLSGLAAGAIASYCLGYGQWLTLNSLWVLLAALVLGGLGFADDLLKILKKHNKGVTGYTKLAVQAAVGLMLGLYSMFWLHDTHLSIFNRLWVDLGWAYPVFAMLTVMATSNAVNLTDGLDGLAAGTTVFSLLGFMAVLLLFPHSLSSPQPVYLDLVSVCVLLLGVVLAFWLYNRHPARVFMGDTGSLALGGALAAIAILAKLELWLFLLGAVFVLEALSVVLQVLSFKTTGRRIFRMSPLHHHFELGGWPEQRVVWTFIVFQALCCGLGALLFYLL